MKRFSRSVVFFLSALTTVGLVNFSKPLLADENALKIRKVNEHVYALVGKRGPISEKDLGTNATFGVIVTNQGVVLVDPSASFKGAARIHKKVREITEKPITTIINTGSEDQRWLGNGYFKQLGAKIIAARAAVEDQKSRSNQLLSRLVILLKDDGFTDTDAVFADQVFENELTLYYGGQKIVLYDIGTTYTPGSTVVWLPEKRILFSGDAFTVERMPAIGSMSNTENWIKGIHQIIAMNPRHINPGHGQVTNVNGARRDNLAYLVSLRQKIGALIDGGGDLGEVSNIDQSEFERLIGFEMLKGRNANQVYQELEWQ